jgi:NTE family protein
VDVIGGTSMGAVMAAAYARGWPPSYIMEKIREVFTASRAVIDLTFPMASLLTGRKLDRALKYIFEDVQIEDLWTSFYCLSSNVTDARARIHQSGPLWKSVRSSVSLPGIFPPVQMDDQVLVDGGVINNVPIDVMRERCPGGGTVIGIDVGGSGGSGHTWNEHLSEGTSGWRLLGNSVFPFMRSNEVPTIFQTLLWSTTLSSKQYTDTMIANGSADLFLRPPVQEFGLLGFDAYEKLFEVGYEYGKIQLAEWQGAQRFKPGCPS